MPGVGAIHIDEIEPTLDALEKKLGIDLKNNVLGSVGKREFSGDIDVALEIGITCRGWFSLVRNCVKPLVKYVYY